MKLRHYKRVPIKVEGDTYKVYDRLTDIGKVPPAAVFHSYEEAAKWVDSRLYRFRVEDVLNAEIIKNSDPVFHRLSDAKKHAEIHISRSGLKRRFPKDIIRRHLIEVIVYKGPGYDHLVQQYTISNIDDYVYKPVYVGYNDRVIGVGDEFVGSFKYRDDLYIPKFKSVIGLPYGVVAQMGKVVQ